MPNREHHVAADAEGGDGALFVEDRAGRDACIFFSLYRVIGLLQPAMAKREGFVAGELQAGARVIEKAVRHGIRWRALPVAGPPSSAMSTYWRPSPVDRRRCPPSAISTTSAPLRSMR